ncbi:MAG TPA: HD domain-containing protein [Methylococcales bacterium]
MQQALQLLDQCLDASLLNQSGKLSPVTQCFQSLDPRYALEFAVIVAWRAHSGQVRKGSSTPYISHPLAVAKMLLKADCSQEVVVAALLHDTVEDTATTLEYIRDTFGETVAMIVAGCTELHCDLGWEECKRRHIARIETACRDVQMVTCADKLHNVCSMASQYTQRGESWVFLTKTAKCKLADEQNTDGHNLSIDPALMRDWRRR